MQTNLLVGPTPTPINGYCCLSFSSIIDADSSSITSPSWTRAHQRHRNPNPNSRDRSHRSVPVTALSSQARVNGDLNHYAVLGIKRNATFIDIKRAYRLLARKFHPDVSKDSRAGEIFKTIHRAYEVLSNEATRIQYDRSLKLHEANRSNKFKRNPSIEFEDGVKTYNWSEIRQKMQYERYQRYYHTNWETSSSYETDDEVEEEEDLYEERVSFIEVLKSTFLSLFLLQTVGYRLSLTFSSLMALFDKKLDTGYKIGYAIAWILGGQGGILLTLCLSFASWVCGKTSSSVVTLVVFAMWIGSNLARYAPLPQGALLTLLYMSIKLQTDLN